MSLHIFGAVVTAHGTAANNRGETEGNTTTLQKLIWNGQVHTTVSAESIRFALRRRLSEREACNRSYDESARLNQWADPVFSRWTDGSKEIPHIDDDLLGYMAAEAAKDEGGGEAKDKDKDKSKAKAKGTAKVRRAVLEISRAVSLTPWSGDFTFNAASPGATPSAAKKGTSNPVPYATEMHATRYQYGFALTPERLRVANRAAIALEGLCALGEVAGNHGRFLFDFSPESIVLRITTDPAPRILYSYESTARGELSMPSLLQKVQGGDILAGELVIGGAIVSALGQKELDILKGASLYGGVKAACQEACKRIAAGGKAQ